MIRAGQPRTLKGSRRLGLAPTLALSFNPITAGVGAAVGLASTALAGWMQSIQTSHNADTATTLIVNGLEQQLKNLRDAYLAETNPSCADQRAALDAYDQAWQWLQSPYACGAPNYGRAGNACISDRAPGGRWPWQTYYRDPIANDPRLAGQNCNTSLEVLLPSLSSGTYSATGLTASGGGDVRPIQSAQPAASAIAAPAAGINPIYLAAALGLGAYLLLK